MSIYNIQFQDKIRKFALILVCLSYRKNFLRTQKRVINSNKPWKTSHRSSSYWNSTVFYLPEHHMHFHKCFIGILLTGILGLLPPPDRERYKWRHKYGEQHSRRPERRDEEQTMIKQTPYIKKKKKKKKKKGEKSPGSATITSRSRSQTLKHKSNVRTYEKH